MKAKFSHKFVLVVLALLVLMWTFYAIFGRTLIGAMHEGKSIGFLNNIIEGRDIHSVEHYHTLAAHFLKKISLCVLIMCSVIFIFSCIKLSPNQIAVLFGILFSAVCIFAIELVLRKLDIGDTFLYTRYYPTGFTVEDEFGVLRGLEGTHRVHSVSTRTGKVLFDNQYTIDELGRRRVPLEDRKNRNKFILCFGGSFMFGDGVEDYETIPYVVGKERSLYMPYNYGYSTNGPFSLLARLETTHFPDEVKEQNGALVYLFIDNHIHRTIGSMSTMKWNYRGMYYKKDKEGKLVRAGNFLSEKPVLTRLYRILEQSRILRLLRIDFPPRITNAHIQLVAQAIKQMQTSFKKQYPNAPFYVALYPGSIYGKRLIRFLEEKNIQYFDYTDLFDINDPKFYLADEDRHPSPFAHQLVAEKIAMDLP